ncbi:MAG TPA: MauE/DoxX family redox-associated membrane protein [Balneolaceae bacterium]|nr:MauE/DoxX family redox-associated membrane protein [Balneolaceae bacterium]
MTLKSRRIALITIRIILGLVFLLSGIGKLISSGDARYMVELLATKFYWLVEYTGIIVHVISVIELLLAIMLLWGKKLRWTLSAALLLILAFSSVLSYYYVQGFDVKSCGCFGAFHLGGGLAMSLLKNLVLLSLIAGAYLLLFSQKKSLQGA